MAKLGGQLLPQLEHRRNLGVPSKGATHALGASGWSRDAASRAQDSGVELAKIVSKTDINGLREDCYAKILTSTNDPWDDKSKSSRQ